MPFEMRSQSRKPSAPWQRTRALILVAHHPILGPRRRHIEFLVLGILIENADSDHGFSPLLCCTLTIDAALLRSKTWSVPDFLHLIFFRSALPRGGSGARLPPPVRAARRGARGPDARRVPLRTRGWPRESCAPCPTARRARTGVLKPPGAGRRARGGFR